MSPKVSEAHVKSRKRDILDAAAVCFARAGLHGATMDGICTQAGVSKGAVYGYFKSKDALISALKVESVQRDAAIIRSTTQSGDPEEAFSAMFAAVLDTVGSGPGGVKWKTDVLTWAESLLSQRLLDSQVIETQLWADALEILAEEAQRRGRISANVDARAMGWTLTSVIYGAVAVRSWDDNFDPSQVVAVVSDILSGRSFNG